LFIHQRIVIFPTINCSSPTKIEHLIEYIFTWMLVPSQIIYLSIKNSQFFQLNVQFLFIKGSQFFQLKAHFSNFIRPVSTGGGACGPLASVFATALIPRLARVLGIYLMDLCEYRSSERNSFPYEEI